MSSTRFPFEFLTFENEVVEEVDLESVSGDVDHPDDDEGYTDDNVDCSKDRLHRIEWCDDCGKMGSTGTEIFIHEPACKDSCCFKNICDRCIFTCTRCEQQFTNHRDVRRISPWKNYKRPLFHCRQCADKNRQYYYVLAWYGERKPTYSYD